jgi:hypothetical protein
MNLLIKYDFYEDNYRCNALHNSHINKVLQQTAEFSYF